MNQQPHIVMVTSNVYIQQPGIMHHSGEWVRKFGKHAFIVAGTKSWNAAGDHLQHSLSLAEVHYTLERFGGECSFEEVNRLAELVTPDMDLIIGVGGGKLLDAAKALADKLNLPLVTIPTIAATCAAVTNLSVMYSIDGVYVGFPIFYKNAVLTLVDTMIIAQAPVQFLISGIGDTIAKWFEAQASSSGKYHNAPTLAGLQMAKLLYEILLEHSEHAVVEARANRISSELEQVVDAIILLSGAVGGFGEQNCRSAAAHAIHNGLTFLEESHDILHGIKVAYGIIVQLVLENRPKEELDELLGFYRKVGLPATLRELGISIPIPELSLNEVVRISLLPESTMGMMPFPVTQEMVKQAILSTQGS